MTNHETPQFFPNRRQQRLFAIVHAPASNAADIAVVYCAPLFEDKLWAHRIAVDFGRSLAARGIPALRFDYYGDGESEGLFEDASIDSRLDDIVDAVEFFSAAIQCKRIFLVGLCYGATLALAAASRSNTIAGVAAWQPVLDGSRYVGDLLRANLTTQMVLYKKVLHDRDTLVAQIRAGNTVNVEGYEIGSRLYDQITALDVSLALNASVKPLLILQIAPGANTEREYTALETNPPAKLEFQKVREIKFWVQQRQAFPVCVELFNSTVDWILRQVDPTAVE